MSQPKMTSELRRGAQLLALKRVRGAGGQYPDQGVSYLSLKAVRSPPFPQPTSSSAAGASSLPIMPGPKRTMTSRTPRGPLLASERLPAVLFQDASVSSILHSQPAPRWPEEPQGANQTGRSHPKPDQTVNCTGWPSLLLARSRDPGRKKPGQEGRGARRPRARGQHA